MKVLIINGSPHVKGTTSEALKYVIEELNNENIETEIINVSADTLGCMACGYCHKNGECIRKDNVNEAIEKFKECDGLVIGTPVHYANPSGALLSFVSRFFYAGAGKYARHKAAACVSVSRRSGNTSAFDALNKFFTITSMNIIGSDYWNEVYGNNASEADEDLEGIRTMRTLGRNMAYYLKMRKLAKDNNLEEPEKLPKERTNFIR